MVDEVGQIINSTEDPTEERVDRWKEFLTRPENLATSLTLIAGLAQGRREGESTLGAVSRVGLGAAAARGGIERSVQEQRRQKGAEELAGREQGRKERQTGAQIDTAREANRISREGLDIQRESQAGQEALRAAQAEQASGRAVANRAQASLFERTDPNIRSGSTAKPPITGDPVTDLFLEQAFENQAVGEPIDLNAIIAQSERFKLLRAGAESGKVRPVTVDGQQGLEIDDDFAQSLGLVAIPEPGAVPGAEPRPQGGGKVIVQADEPIEGFGGLFKERTIADVANRLRRRAPETLGDLDDESIVQTVVNFRKSVQDGSFRQLESEQLQNMLNDLRIGLDAGEVKVIRRELQDRRRQGATPSQSFDLGGFGSI